MIRPATPDRQAGGLRRGVRSPAEVRPEPSSLHLRDDVFIAAIDTDLAILDIAADQYICLPQVLNAGEAFDCSAPHTWPRDLIQRLSTLGLLTNRPGAADRRVPALPRASSLHVPPSRRPGLADAFSALQAVRSVGRQCGAEGLLPLLAPAPPSFPRLRSDTVAAVEAARTFAHLLPWMPIEGACLVRSALLLQFLHRKGLQADWVFGIRLWPFSAHCWIQAGDVCLNDDAERLIGFTPIYRR